MGDSLKMGQLVSRTVCGVVGALYPGYMSYKAIKNTDVREYKRWMEYWTVYSFFLVAELFLDVFVSWLPFYYEGKILFMVWLMMGGGARMVFRQFLKPTLALHEDKIDEQFEMMKNRQLKDGTACIKDGLRRGGSSVSRVHVIQGHQEHGCPGI